MPSISFVDHVLYGVLSYFLKKDICLNKILCVKKFMVFYCFQLASVENEAAMLEQMVREQEEELAKTREENELEKVNVMFCVILYKQCTINYK